MVLQTLKSFVQNGDIKGLKIFLNGNPEAVKYLSEENQGAENGGSILHLAVQFGRTNCVSELLAYKIDPDPLDDENATPLILAAREGYTDMCMDLLRAGADLDHKDVGGWTALIWACYKGRTETVRCLIDRGAEVHSSGHHNAPPIIWAAGRGYTEIAKILLEHKANPNRPDKHGNTPLIWAARKGFLEIVELLLKHGAKVDVVGMKSWTPLLVAVEGNFRGVVRKLLEKKPNLSVMDVDGHTPLTIACKKGYTEICQMLLDAGSTVNSHDRYGDTILIHAVKNGHRQIVEKLIKKYAEVDAQGKGGKTALHWAITKNQTSILKILLHANPNIEIVSDDGDTPFLCAAKERNPDAIQALLEKRAKVAAVDKSGDTALHIAMRARNRAIAELILKDMKNSKLLYRPNKAGETPYNIDYSNEKPILVQISGSRRLFTSQDSENSLGYDLYGGALADILIDPMTALPLTIGLFAKWGSGKSFLIGKLKEELQNFGNDCIDQTFRINFSLVLLLLNMSLVLGLTVGIALNDYLPGTATSGVLLIFGLACVLGLSAYGGRNHSYYKPGRFFQLFSWLNSFILLNKVIFCHPPDENAGSSKDAKPLQFVFADQARVSPGSSEVSVLGIIISLFEKIENKYGEVTTRMCRLFLPKIGKGQSEWRFRRVCCLPSVVLFIVLVDITLVGVGLMANYLLGIMSPTSDLAHDLTAVKAAMITCGVIFAVSLIASVNGMFRAFLALAVSPRSRLKKEMARFATLGSDGQHLHVLREEVKQLTNTIRTLDAFCGRTTRMTIALDGLDTCKQEQVVAILDAVSLLFSEPNSPFVVLLAIDPHLVAKAIESNVSCVLSESPLTGNNYLRNVVQLPFYLQNAGLRKIKISQQAALTARGFSEDTHNGNSGKMAAKRMPSDASVPSSGLRRNRSSAANLNRKYQLTDGEGYTRYRNLSDSVESGIAMMGAAHQGDITKVLLTDDYFSDVNPKSLRRLMNVVAVSGRLMKAFHIDFNWIHLASWINLTEQWPYRMSWIIVYVEERESRLEDCVSLRALYERVKDSIPKAGDPFLDLDKDPKKLEALLSSNRNNLQLVHLKIFIPFTINLDPYLGKYIKENRKDSIPPPLPPTHEIEGSRLGEAERMGRDSEDSAHCSCLAPSGTVCLHPPIPDVLLRQPLAEVSTEILCHGVQLIEGLSASRLQEMADVLKSNNICGRVLLLCSLEDLKPVLTMGFGDWELFKSLVLAMRNREAALPVRRQEATVNPHRAAVRHDSSSGYDKQITLEEQSIHGALQVLNEEASEDVNDNAIVDEDVSSGYGETSNTDETEVLFLQTNPVVSTAAAVIDIGSSNLSLVTPTNPGRSRTVTEVLRQETHVHSLSRASSQRSVFETGSVTGAPTSILRKTKGWNSEASSPRRPTSQEVIINPSYQDDDDVDKESEFNLNEERQPLVTIAAKPMISDVIHERRRSVKGDKHKKA